MCLDGADFFWNGQDLFEAAALAELILEQPRPPRYWIIVAAPSAQSYDNGGVASPRAGRRREIHRLMFRQGHYGMIGGDWRQLIVTAVTPALGYDAWGERFHQLLARTGVVPERPARVGQRANMEVTLDPLTAADKAEAFTGTQAENLARTAYYDPTVARRSTRAMLALNRHIQDAGGVMILVTPPMTLPVRQSTLRALPDQVVEFEAMQAQLIHEGAVVSNHWDDAAYGEAWSLYTDNQHLNGAGADQFSVHLAQALRAKGVLPNSTCREGDARRPGVTTSPAEAN
tara:strand:+ start:250 stop:1110 length:861 start_codon:yes stop_codon:yes gene_type:complete